VMAAATMLVVFAGGTVKAKGEVKWKTNYV
jgi:hypothetical protein